jgi:hypothetical protein
MKRIITTLILILCQLVQSENKTEHPSVSNITCLPVFIGWCGTNAPSYVKTKEARLIINKIFKDHNYKLKENYKIKYDGIECILSGYDEKNKVGYLYGDWDNLDEDALRIWNFPHDGQELFLNSVAHYLGEEYKQEIEKAESIGNKKKQQAFLWSLIRKFRENKSINTLSLKEAELLPELYKKKKIFILFITQFDRRFSYYQHINVMVENLKKRLEKEKNSKSRKEIEHQLKRLHYSVSGEATTKKTALNNIKKNVNNALKWLENNR